MNLLQIYCRVSNWKNFENRIIVGEIMAKSLVSCFFLTHGVFLIFSTEAAQYECSYRRTTPLVPTLPLVCGAVLLRCVMTRYQCANLVTKTPQFDSSYSVLSPVRMEFLPFSQPSVLVQPALPMRGRGKCDTWICGTWKCGTMLQGWKMRDTKMRETR